MATNGFETGKLNIRTFTNGINESVDDTLVKFYETTRAYNVENSKGTLKPLELPVTIYSSDGELKSVANFYGTDSKYMLLAINGDIYKYANNSINSISTNQNNILDSLCFENQGERISVIVKIGSLSSSPITISTFSPFGLTTTPWIASGIAVHWYFLIPP